MTAINTSNSFAKNVESNKRLIHKKHPLHYDASFSQQRKVRRSSLYKLQEISEVGKGGILANCASTAVSSTTAAAASFRLHGEMRYKHADDKANRRSGWQSPIGTIADHRMTNNNRIRKQWHIFAVILLSLILCLVQITVVNGHPDPVPTPVRVSHSYTKTVSNTIPTSTTSRSTTQLTSFLPSDAISSMSASVINYKNYNTFASNRSSSNSGTRINSSIYSFRPKNVSSASSSISGSNKAINNYNNANIPSSSRRSTPVKANRKDFSSQTTSIDRPFYTKITSNDAVATPTHYKRTKSATTKKSKKSKNSSKSPSSFNKYSKTKGSKEHTFSSSSASVEEIDNDEYAFMPQTTEKSYHPPKLSLEPFFNFLTSLATASREVIMSKEQHHHNNNNNNHHQHQTELSSSTTGGSSKYSSSYETINQSMREGAKKSKKSKKGKSKKKSKSKGSKKGHKGGGKRHRLKSIESLEDEDFELDPPSEEPIHMPLSNPIIDSAEEEKENDNDSPLVDGMESPGGFHILDVLRTPMIPDYESPSQAARAEPLVALDFPDANSNGGSIKNDGSSNHSHKNDKNIPFNNASSSSSSFSSNPPSGRANLNKGQGYLAFDNYDGTKNISNSSSMNKQKTQREKQLSERDPMDSFHEQQQHGGVDLTAQESISHAQVVPSPFGMKTDAGGLAPSQYQYQQQQNPKSNNNELSYSSASSQQVSLTQTNSPEYASAGKNAAGTVEGNNAFRQQQQSLPNGKNDFVSKYPTTFVYQPNSGASPPGPRPNMNPSPPGIPPNNNAVIYGSPPLSSRPPFRMNKLRPNLHSYYDSSYHNYAGMGESQVASEMIGIRHPYGPPHFKPPPRVMHHPHPLPSPPRFVNGYGNRPGFMGMPHRGTHYVGHTFNNAAPPASSSSREPITQPYDPPNTDYQQDVTGNGNNNENSSVDNQNIDGSDVAGSGTDNIDQYPVSEIDDELVTTAENSETKKVGIMDSFDLFYKEYKILTWVAVFFCTSMALLTLLVYLYINNPPTEVVQARQLFPWTDLLKNPQITRFLSNLAESSGGNRKRKKDNPVDDDYDEMGYLKPYGKGFGGKSGKQKRKQTRSQQDRNKFFQRVNKIKRLNEIGSSNNSSNVASTLTSSNGNRLVNI